MKNPIKYILRRKTNDSESDKYQYYISCEDGVQLTTPFKEKATQFNGNETIQATDKDWEFIRFKIVK